MLFALSNNLVHTYLHRGNPVLATLNYWYSKTALHIACRLQSLSAIIGRVMLQHKPQYLSSNRALKNSHTLTQPLQRAAHLWSQSEKGNTLAWQDPRERGGKGLGLKPPQETIFLSPALLYGADGTSAKPLTQISSNPGSANRIHVATESVLTALIFLW